MKKWLTLYNLLFLMLLSISTGFAQPKQYSFEQLDSLQSVAKKPVLVFIHTEWCKYCHAMKNNTLKNKTVTKEINKKTYFISFNAEEKRTITFDGDSYHPKTNSIQSGVHELTEKLTKKNKKITYPTLVLLNEKNEIINLWDGFLTAKEILVILDKL
jgi:thioredoxin-related protein